MMGDGTRAIKYPVQNLHGMLGKFTEMGMEGVLSIGEPTRLSMLMILTCPSSA
jgi:hypothetical protein